MRELTKEQIEHVAGAGVAELVGDPFASSSYTKPVSYGHDDHKNPHKHDHGHKHRHEHKHKHHKGHRPY